MRTVKILALAASLALPLTAIAAPDKAAPDKAAPTTPAAPDKAAPATPGDKPVAATPKKTVKKAKPKMVKKGTTPAPAPTASK